MLAVFIAFLVILRWWRKEKELHQINWKVKYADLVFEDGKFNKVAKLNDEYVTVNMIDRKAVREDKKLLEEMKTLKAMCHSNLTTFVGACCDIQNVCAIWEHCSKGPLEDILLNSSSNMDPVRQINIALDIANGLLYIHSSDIRVHGNLKMSSIVVDSHWVAKITDFGLATFRRKEKLKENKTAKTWPMFVDRFSWRILLMREKRNEGKGEEVRKEATNTKLYIKEEEYRDLFWTSPERLRCRMKGEKDCATKESDVYSLGVVLSQIIGEHTVYGGRLKVLTPKDIITKVAFPGPGSTMMRPCIPEEIGGQSVAMATCSHLINGCWSERIPLRPSIRKIVKLLKRLTIIKDKTLWDTMTTVKKRYSSKLAPLVGKTGTWCNVYRSIPRDMETEMYQDIYVTVCSWSIVNFTTFAILSSPAEALQVIQDIDELMSNITTVFKVFQVETVCDSSMLISGYNSNHNPNHASVMADASLALMDFVSNLQVHHGPHYHNSLSVRIGLNSGPVMVGVIGKLTPHFCVFGKTARSALQCEKDSFSQRIHISSSTFNHLQETEMFSLEPRNPLDSKNVDGEPSYWLTGRIQEIQESQL